MFLSATYLNLFAKKISGSKYVYVIYKKPEVDMCAKNCFKQNYSPYKDFSIHSTPAPKELISEILT